MKRRVARAMEGHPNLVVDEEKVMCVLITFKRLDRTHITLLAERSTAYLNLKVELSSLQAGIFCPHQRCSISAHR